jgi:hypothetical protein
VDQEHDAISDERKFLHDIATPISIVRLLAKRLLKLCVDRQGTETETKLIEQILGAVDAMEKLHANHKLKLEEEKPS